MVRGRALIPIKALGKLPLVFSGDARGAVSSMERHDTNDVLVDDKSNGHENKAERASDIMSQAAAATAFAPNATTATEGRGMPLGVGETIPSNGSVGIGGRATSRGQSVRDTDTGRRRSEERESGHSGRVEGGSQIAENVDGDAFDDQNDDNDNDNDSSSIEGVDNNDWDSVENGERTGYAGVAVEPLAVAERVNGSCFKEVCAGGWMVLVLVLAL